VIDAKPGIDFFFTHLAYWIVLVQEDPVLSNGRNANESVVY